MNWIIMKLVRKKNSTRLFFFFICPKIFVMLRSKNSWEKIERMNIVVWSCCPKILLCDILCFTISICDSIQRTIYLIFIFIIYIYLFILIRRIMTFDHEKLLLLKSMQDKVAWNIVIPKLNKASWIYYICQKHFKIKLLTLQMS